jgi:hypothetical protein
MTTTHKWQFVSRFRRRAFGWRSDMPIQRIKEAVAEIKLVARKDPPLAARGAVALLEKLSPALEQVDSSSGAIGTAVNRAIEALVPIIAKAEVGLAVRRGWLARLWQALLDDHIPYLESLGDHWGELCVSTELASEWADELHPQLAQTWSRKESDGRYFQGTSVCLSALHAAGRHEQLLSFLERAPFKWWHYRRWGVKALVAMGRKAEAVQYAQETRHDQDPNPQIARACETILLSSGLADEAYRLYAIEANQGMSHLATFRAIVKKYPARSPESVLRDLVACTPGAEGKWFAAAKDAGLFVLACELANASPTDPRTLARAARDFATSEPDFAVAAGLAALRWISLGHGYELTGGDIRDAYRLLMLAVKARGGDAEKVRQQVRQMMQVAPVRGTLMQSILASEMAM